MKQQLKVLQDFIQQNQQLNPQEKEALLQSIKEADKEFTITEFKLDRTEKVKRTTAILLEETIEELEQKRKAVEEKNYELEIENALEKVRAIALSMKEPADMPEVCKIIATELDKLGVKEIRNVQTAIFYESKGTYMNYEYYAKHDKTIITEVSYTNHKMHQAFADQMLKGKGEFFSTYLSKAELQNWIAYQKTTNVFNDSYIETASSLNYYWYSLGPVALGISTYVPLTDEEINLFKRFLKVFELAYTRYLDIEQAIAQLREAQIEAALEKVRSRSMGMQKSEELKEVIQAVYEQFVQLNIYVEHAGFIMDYKERDDMHIWLADKHEVPSEITFPYFDSPHWNSFIEAKEKGMDFFSNHFTFDEKNKFYQELFKLFPVPDEAKEYYFTCPGLAISTVLLDNVGLYIENFSGTPYSDDENNTLMRFGKVFQQTYTRFLDLEKAEAQAREATIEAALEKVRSRSLAMRKSDEIMEVAITVFEKMTELGVDMSGGISIVTFFPDSKDLLHWLLLNGMMVNAHLPYFDHIIFNDCANAREQGLDFFTNTYTGEVKASYFRHILKESGFSKGPEEIKKWVQDQTWFGFSYAIQKNSGIFLNDYTGKLFSNETNDTLKRFSRVFEQAYVRFLDLQKAEAQSRESQIQLALERVRARTMAMYQSTELAETSSVLFQQIKDLGFETWSCGFCIWSKDDLVEVWMGADSGGLLPPMMIPYTKEPTHHEIYKASLRGDAVHEKVWEGEALEEHYEYLKSIPSVATAIRQLENAGLSLPSKQCYYVGFFKQGYLLLITKEPNAEMHGLSKRFAGVFEQTYTRFLDLQKAEAQAKESQIELSLERVRAKTMAMHNSEDVGETAAAMVDELKKLGIETIRCGIGIMHEPGDMEVWTISTNENEKRDIIIGWLDMNMHPLLHGAFESWRNKNEAYSYDLKDDDLLSYYNAINNYPGYPIRYDTSVLPELIHHNEFHFAEGTLFAFSLEQLSQEQRKIFSRFAKVFGQTYRRYLDLQKAEAQAREAKIEVSLERVRSKAMAMQKSEDLANAVAIVFEELDKLNLGMLRCGIGIINKKNRSVNVWASTKSDKDRPVQVSGDESMDTHPLLRGAFNAWLNQEEYSYILHGKDLTDYYKTQVSANFKLPDSHSLITANEDVQQYYFLATFQAGGLFAFREEAFSEEAKVVMKRFADVFNLTYTRFNDLQLAEAQAKESQIEAALERVRSRTLAMQKSDELSETSAVLFQQLIALGIAPNRLYVGVINDESGNIEFWITDEDGSKVSTMFTGNAHENASMKKMYNGWKQQKKSIAIDMHGKELADYFNYLGEQLHVPFKDRLLQKRRVQYITYFSKGFIGMASPEEQPKETVDLLERFSYVFNLTFTRFSDLKIAEAHAIQAEEDLIKLQTEKKRAEEALTELKETQKQLIQSEKMASLGELTAGIAHEIQNPLNFVNNFSEVSKELLEEMKTALANGDENDAKELADDVIQNLEKINHHGKRADAIVKGMLQHSRSSTNQKEPTNINALCDEFIRLCYHGIRAKDNSFNANIKTDFDSNIRNINIISQDIGRVLLNLLTNAFYACAERTRSAVNEKKKNTEENYKPEISVSTKKLDNIIEIKVTDNGNGIPQNIVDKIFQPFFTTKPTGQGTGLGLSISYDIIKAHGGDIKVETMEDEGSEFIIQLPIV